jgi:predicted PurR-regulated permease PerM
MNIKKRNEFIINVIYWAIILLIFYLIFKYLLNLVMPFIIALLVAWILRPLSKLFKRKLKKHPNLAVPLSVGAVVLFYLIIGSLLLLVVAQAVGGIADYMSDIPRIYTQTIEPGLRISQCELKNLPPVLIPALSSL